MTVRWYIVQTHTAFEKKVAQTIKDQARLHNIEDLFEEVLVPTEEVVEMRPGGKKVSAERKFFPGYVLVKMEMNNETYHLVKSVPKVSGFLGTANKPTPISEKEAEHILQQVKEGVDRPRPSISFEIGEEVRVTDGPFESFTGLVEEVDHDRSRLKVSVSIFGRATPVELEYSQVTKG
jgi:transcriptional antiterminator NusG